MGKKKLNPCPFCEGEAELNGTHSGGRRNYAIYYVVCLGCSARGSCKQTNPGYPDSEITINEAIQAWNRRV